ncbi:MAG TPA: HEPN domain-containing protein [Acidobacteriota bacterium]|nr:HEPN domain-containing protein [Acidobacteriota bacterium]
MSPEELKSLMDRARRSLRSAHRLLEAGDNDFAISRAYYAMYYAATAALLSQGLRRSKHSAVIAAFGQHLVKAGKFTPEQHRLLQIAFEDRTEGDYEGVFPSREQVEARLREAEDFVQAADTFLKGEKLDI